MITPVEAFSFYSRDDNDRGNRRASDSDYDRKFRV